MEEYHVVFRYSNYDSCCFFLEYEYNIIKLDKEFYNFFREHIDINTLEIKDLDLFKDDVKIVTMPYLGFFNYKYNVDFQLQSVYIECSIPVDKRKIIDNFFKIN